MLVLTFSQNVVCLRSSPVYFQASHNIILTKIGRVSSKQNHSMNLHSPLVTNNMKTEDCFKTGELEAISKILADQHSGLTGTEIGHKKCECSVPISHSICMRIYEELFFFLVIFINKVNNRKPYFVRLFAFINVKNL